MNIAVLFDGGGLARLGLEKAGHKCTGFELNPVTYYLSLMVGSGNCIHSDVEDVDLDEFDAVWASPPCQTRSVARTQGNSKNAFTGDYLEWCLSLKIFNPNLKYLWVENVISEYNSWGEVYNAAQFCTIPIQNRNRIIGGDYPTPRIYREYQKYYPNICPAIVASEYKGCSIDKRRASRFYGRRLTIEECAYHQGFVIPREWHHRLKGYTQAEWKIELYQTIGNGVPVYMSYGFGITAK